MLASPADLSVFRGQPRPRLISGLVLMGVSYIMGWPAVAFFGLLAVWYEEPLIAVIGGPTTYGLSCVVFIFGAWLARVPQYLGVLIRFAIQSALRRMLS